MSTEFLVRFGIAWVSITFSLLIPRLTQAYTIHSAEVKVFSSGVQEESFFGFDANFTGGGRVAAGDIDGDGEEEIIVGAGRGGGPNVRVFERDGTPLNSFMAYDRGFRGGVAVAAADVDGDGSDEIITGTGIGGGPDVRVFDRFGNRRKSFLAYDPAFRGGVFVAAGDVTGDGIAEIVTGSGPGGRSHVRVFNGSGEFLGLDFWPYDPRSSGGVAVAVGNVIGDARSEIITGLYSAGKAEVKVYGYESTRPIYGTFFAYPSLYEGGITVATANVAGDTAEEILTMPSAGAPHLRAFSSTGRAAGLQFFAYPEQYRGGSFVTGVGDPTTTYDRIVTVPGNGLVQKRPELARYIETDLSEQRLYAYENGLLVKTFLVSTGVRGFVTPTGQFHVSQKIPVKHYSGPGYNLPNTKWNLRYDGPRLLHGAYWHNDFGRPKSHGCTNISYPNAEWLYGWAPVGTTVVVKS